MKKGKIIAVVIFLILILILSFNKKEDGVADVNGDIVEYDEPLVVDSTANLITKSGHYLSIIIESAFEYIFVIINKIISFVLGI
mgnify:CR=1 FL=1